MPDIARRNFLFGTVATAATAAGLLLKTPEDAVEIFKPTLGETLALTRIDPAEAPRPTFSEIVRGELFDSRNRTVCDFVVRSVSITPKTERLEVTSFGAVERQFVQGLLEHELEVLGYLNPRSILREGKRLRV